MRTNEQIADHTAKIMADTLGLDAAIERAKQQMDENCMGSFSHAFHNSVWKSLLAMQENELIEAAIVRDEIRKGDY